MKIAVLGDIHGNLPAMEAVLRDAKQRRATSVWCLGDLVGYGPFPDEVVAAVREGFILSLRGNYDSKVLRIPTRDPSWFQEKGEEKARVFTWAWEHLSPESREYLASLPESLRLTVEGHRVLLVHGSPASPREHLSPDTPEERLAALGEECGAAVVLCAHSHIAFARRGGKTLFINPGSVGRPDDGDPRASYALVTFRRPEVEVAFHRLPYDVDRCVEAVRAHGLPEDLARIFREGRSLDGIRESDPPSGDVVRRQVVAVAEKYVDMREHHLQVASLALALFDGLGELHALGEEERGLLEYAALLHDIGWCEGRARHHKWTEKLVMEDDALPFSRRHRRMVACIARYHRRAFPEASHETFGALAEEDRKKVRALAAILRLADALDASHLDLVEGLSCQVGPEKVLVTCVAGQPPQGEDEAWARKGALFRSFFGREAELRWTLRS